MSDDATSALDLDGAAVLARAPHVHALVDVARASGLELDGAYLVGGAVRDAFLGLDPGPDVDIAYEGVGVAFAHLLATATGGVVESEHAFGTATLNVPLPDPWGMVRVDVASCRTEEYAVPGVLPTVTLDAPVAADLARRDVTVNAVAISLEPAADGTHAVVDPEGGREDVDARILRVLHDGSFVDDPTRIFRVARYAGRLGFRVDDHTRALAVEAVGGDALATISAERLRAELRLVLREPAWEALTLLASWGVLERLDPRLEEAFRRPLLLRAIDDACGADPQLNARAWTLRLAALARPLGEDAAGWLGWLGFPNDVVVPVLDHLHVLRAVLARGEELRGLRNSELYVELGEVSDDSIALAALAIGDDDPQLLQRLVEFSRAARDAALTVRGDDVISAGVPAGPLVGRILGDLFLRTLDGELRGEADERAALEQHAAEFRRDADRGGTT